jgi:two-component sensor histidine kinase
LTCPFRRLLARAILYGETGSREFIIRRGEDDDRTVLAKAAPIRADDGKVIAGIVVFVDITEQKRADEAIRTALREKESLLREIHHRVKNNLQVITSLLRLEAGQCAEPATKAVLREMQSRIFSMALLHETLYRSGNFAQVELAGYLKQLATQLFRAHNTSSSGVRLRLELAPFSLEMDQAIPVGLIVNELVTNCLKHAFPNHRGGEVRLTSWAAPTGGLSIQVSDTGKGLPAGFTPGQSHTLGLQLVSDLTRQLHGSLTIGSGPGAEFTITIPPEVPAPPAPPPTQPS